MISGSRYALFMFTQGLTPSLAPTWAKLLSLQEFALAAWSLASIDSRLDASRTLATRAEWANRIRVPPKKT